MNLQSGAFADAALAIMFVSWVMEGLKIRGCVEGGTYPTDAGRGEYAKQLRELAKQTGENEFALALYHVSSNCFDEHASKEDCAQMAKLARKFGLIADLD